MLKRTAAVLSILLLVSSGNLHAGSKFGLNLIGERLDAGDVRSISLGGDMQIIPDSLGVLQSNPALLTLCSKVTVGGLQFVSLDRGKSDGFNEKNVTVKYPVFMLAVPLTKRIVFALGYRGRYDPDASMAIDVASDSVPVYKQVFTKSGGLYSVPLSLAVKPSKYVSLGLYYSIEGGSIEDRWEIRFKEPQYAPSLGLRKTGYSGSGYGGGLVLFPSGPLMIGANYKSEVEFDTDIRERFTQSTLDTSFSGKVKIPSELQISVYWRFSSSWSVLAGAEWRDFRKFEGLDFPQENLRRMERYAIGFEYARKKGLPLRFSFATEQLPYDFPESKRISRYSVALGTGLILSDGKAKIDVALQFGKTGALETNTLEERYIRFFIGMSGSEVWKRHRAAK